MQPDLDQFLAHLKGYDLSDERKRVYLQEIWKVVESFVDRNFGCDATHLAINAKGASDGARRVGVAAARNLKSAGQDSSKGLGFKQSPHNQTD